MLYQILACTIHGKIKKGHTETNLKYQLQRGLKKLNYLIDHISVSDIQDYLHLEQKQDIILNFNT